MTKKKYHVEEVQAGYWRHYKGGVYQVTGTSLHTETGETMVEYINASKEKFTRPFPMWHETVDVAGDKSPRFEHVGATPEEAMDRLSADLRATQEAERISSGVVAQGMGALLDAGVLTKYPDPDDCVLVSDKNGLHGSFDCKSCEGDCPFPEDLRDKLREVRPYSGVPNNQSRAVTDPNKMHGAGDQFPGSDFEEV